MSERRQIGIGIVGAGFLAQIRARCYREVIGIDASIAAVADIDRERADAYARQNGIQTVLTSLEELLALPEVDAVDLCVPNHLHRPMAEAAAGAGKHVICTKPLTAYVGQDLPAEANDAEISGRDRGEMLRVATADARAMVDAAERAGVRLFYGENWVYAPSIRRSLDLLKASRGAILEMRGWECHNGSHSPYSKLWRHTGGGALLRLGAHPIGAMLHLKREEGLAREGAPIRPVSVTAEVSDLSRNPALDEENTRIATGWVDVENWGCAIVAFEDGSRGVAYGSDNMLGGMESKLEVMASNCHLKCQLSPNDLVRAYAPDEAVFGDEYIMEKVSGRAGWSTPIPREDWSSGQLGMIQEFTVALAEGRSTPSDGRLGLDVTRVLYAAYQAAAEGRRVELD